MTCDRNSILLNDTHHLVNYLARNHYGNLVLHTSNLTNRLLFHKKKNTTFTIKTNQLTFTPSTTSVKLLFASPTNRLTNPPQHTTDWSFAPFTDHVYSRWQPATLWGGGWMMLNAIIIGGVAHMWGRRLPLSTGELNPPDISVRRNRWRTMRERPKRWDVNYLAKKSENFCSLSKKTFKHTYLFLTVTILHLIIFVCSKLKEPPFWWCNPTSERFN